VPHTHVPFASHVPPPPASHWASAVHRQDELEHVKPDGQAWPQPPQLSGSVSKLRQPSLQHATVAPVHEKPPLHEQIVEPKKSMHVSPALHSSPWHWQTP
jgi:hypothetical protein